MPTKNCFHEETLVPRRTKTTTIERKVVGGKAIQRHGFIFSHEDANADSSCDEQDSY